MTISDHKGARRTLPRPALTAEAAALAFERALWWRQQWRTELAGKTAAPAPAKDRSKQRSKDKTTDESKRRADYARQVARSELGRHYWNDEQARRLREAMERSQPPPDKPRRKPNGAGR